MFLLLVLPDESTGVGSCCHRDVGSHGWTGWALTANLLCLCESPGPPLCICPWLCFCTYTNPWPFQHSFVTTHLHLTALARIRAFGIAALLKNPSNHSLKYRLNGINFAIYIRQGFIYGNPFNSVQTLKIPCYFTALYRIFVFYALRCLLVSL